MYDVIIIGGGIAGETAAIYAARKRMKFLLIATRLGGQFLESGEILNYPGIVKTTGAEFSSIMEEHLENNNIKPNEGEEVTGIKPAKKGFKVTTDQAEYYTCSVIIATGASPKKLNVPGEAEFKNKGVAYCSICDGPLFADKTIAIVGGGNSALEGVDFTHSLAKKIYVINIMNEFTAHEYLIEKIQSYANVAIIHNAETAEILGDKTVTGLRYKKNNEVHTIDVEGIIIEIGRTPNTQFLVGLVEMDEHGHINIDCQARTSIDGIFAAGDCASGHEYQYIIAAGQGCMALLKAARYLTTLRREE